MNKRLEITIPKTCHENWDKMSAVSSGMYCSSCQKEVVDFIDFSEQELREYFLNHIGEKTCGRLSKSQLTLKPHYPDTGTLWSKLRPKLLAASVLVFPLTLKASTGSLAERHPISAVPESKHKSIDAAFQRPSVASDTIKTIRGVVLDKNTGETLHGVLVNLKGTTKRVVTDSKGVFLVNVNNGIEPVLVFSYIGYDSIEQRLNTRRETPITIILTENIPALMGEVCVVRKPDILQKIIHPFKKLFNK